MLLSLGAVTAVIVDSVSLAGSGTVLKTSPRDSRKRSMLVQYCSCSLLATNQPVYKCAMRMHG